MTQSSMNDNGLTNAQVNVFFRELPNSVWLHIYDNYSDLLSRTYVDGYSAYVEENGDINFWEANGINYNSESIPTNPDIIERFRQTYPFNLNTYMKITNSLYNTINGNNTVYHYNYGYETVYLEDAWGRNLGYRHYAITRDDDGVITSIDTDPSLNLDTTTNPFILGWWTRVVCQDSHSCDSVNRKPDRDRGFEVKDVGIFVDGGDPFTKSDLSAITGSASYSGVIKGVIHNHDDNLTKPLFGNINLDVNFSDEK